MCGQVLSVFGQIHSSRGRSGRGRMRSIVVCIRPGYWMPSSVRLANRHSRVRQLKSKYWRGRDGSRWCPNGQRRAADGAGAGRLWVAAVPLLDECRRRQHLDIQTYFCREVFLALRDRAEAARRAHNPEVTGSNPVPATWAASERVPLFAYDVAVRNSSEVLGFPRCRRDRLRPSPAT